MYISYLPTTESVRFYTLQHYSLVILPDSNLSTLLALKRLKAILLNLSAVMTFDVSVDSASLETIQALRYKKTYRFITFNFSHDRKEIVVDQKSESSDWDDFMQSLPENEPRYAVYDFHYEGSDGEATNRLVFVNWSPNDARPKTKMLFATKKEALVREIPGISADIKVGDHSDITYEQVLGKVTKIR